MSKTNLVMIGAVLAVVIGTGYYAFVRAADANSKQTMMQGAVSQGIISQEQADNLKEYNKNYREQERKDRFEKRLTDAVSNGTITEDEAQQIRDWQNSMPDAMKKLGPMKGMGKFGPPPQDNAE